MGIRNQDRTLLVVELRSKQGMARVVVAVFPCDVPDSAR
jgi:hypothetical protein